MLKVWQVKKKSKIAHNFFVTKAIDLKNFTFEKPLKKWM